MLTEKLILDVDIMLSFADNLLVSVLDAVFDQDTAAPISTTSNNLCSNGSLLATELGVQRRIGVLHVVTNWVLGALDGNKIFIISSATFEKKPINACVSFILVTLDEIPPEDKVFSNVIDRVTNQSHSDIMPWHPAVLCFTDLI
jgi:hypothetical protein